MASIAPATVFTWGKEDPERPIGGAEFNAAVLPPSAFNRDLLTPSAPAGRRRAPMFGPASKRDVGRRSVPAANTSERSTPSASAVAVAEPSVAPSDYNRDALKPAGRRCSSCIAARLDGRSAYRGKTPRAFKRGAVHRRPPQSASAMPLDASTSDVAPAQEAPMQFDKPPLPVLAEAAGQLSTVAADTALRDRLDEIRQQAVALGVRQMASPADFTPGQPGERIWQTLADEVKAVAAELSAASSVDAAAAVSTARARPRPATAAEVGQVGAEVAKLGADTRKAAKLAIMSDIEKEGLRSGEPKTAAQEAAVLNHFFNTSLKRPGWLQRQTSKATSEKDYLAIAVIRNLNRHLGGASIPNKVSRGDALITLMNTFVSANEVDQLKTAVALGKKYGYNFVANRPF